MPRILLILSLFLLYKCGPSTPKAGKITLSQGENITILRQGEKFSPGYFTNLHLGDQIETGKHSAAIITFQNKEAQLELQPASLLEIKIYSPLNHEIMLHRGAAWLKINNNPTQTKFRLRTGVSVTGSRANLIYAKKRSENQWLFCQCEGESYFYHFRSSFKQKIQGGDVISLIDQNGTAFGATTLKKWGIKQRIHQHSTMVNSPLGKKSLEDDKQWQIILKNLSQK